jgi:hypothetical protein
MNKISDILEIDNDLIKSEGMKLLIGDMELSFLELNGCIDHDFTLTNDKRYYKSLGAVVAYLNCLCIMSILTDQQLEKMKKVLEELDELRQKNKSHYENRYKQTKEPDYKYCPHCGREF